LETEPVLSEKGLLLVEEADEVAAEEVLVEVWVEAVLVQAEFFR
jgi:hypothetical protein